MELKIKIGYQELLSLIWQLPVDQLARLRGDIMEKRRPQKMEHKKFQAFLLNGPVMDDDQFESFQANREHFRKWRN